MEDFIDNLKKLCDYFKFNYLLYADDIVFIIHYKYLKILIKCLFSLAVHYNLKINPNKSGIFLIRNHKKIEELEILDIPIIKEYKYLGLIIDNNGSLEPQLKFIK